MEWTTAIMAEVATISTEEWKVDCDILAIITDAQHAVRGANTTVE